MSQPLPPQWQPPIDEAKVSPEVALHLRLVYERLQNHYQAVTNLQNQINALKAQQTTNG